MLKGVMERNTDRNRESESGNGCNFLNRVTMESLTEKMTFEQKFGGRIF